MLIGTHSQNCPLCGNAVEYNLVDAGNRKHFVCVSCSEFQISIGAENRLAKSPPEWRSNLAKQAKEHATGFTLVITLPKPGASGALSGEYVTNASLPK